jgi:metal-responsive CopG/Arc/MetJ family transcriptional regulator
LTVQAPAGHTPEVKTTVSIPTEVFEQAERLAAELRITRSELYSRALQGYLARRAPDHLTEAMNCVIEEVGSDIDELSRRAARRLLEQAEW